MDLFNKSTALSHKKGNVDNSNEPINLEPLIRPIFFQVSSLHWMKNNHLIVVGTYFRQVLEARGDDQAGQAYHRREKALQRRL